MMTRQSARSFRLLTALFGALVMAWHESSAVMAREAQAPNIIIIVADDLGYTDLGSFGGEIDTPNIDRLARSGIRFSNFYAAPTCSPSRAMLLSGVDSHLAGLGNMAEELAPNQKGQPGYEGYLNFRVASLGEVLKSAGYRTYMTGKWHLGLKREHGPAARGFDRSFSLLQGGASHFDQSGLVATDPDALYRENGELVTIPEDFYSSDFFTSKLISYFKTDANSKAPFFAFLSFTAPHWPLQAPDHLIAKYDDLYLKGYEKILEARLARASELGVVPADVDVYSQFPGRREWQELSPEEQKIEARRMAVYAAMVDSLDQNVGHLLDYLEVNGLDENTYVFFLSDNGAEGYDFTGDPWLDNWIEHFDNSYENMGRKGSYIWYGPNWGYVGTAPFRYRKAFTTEGGIRVPGVVYSPHIETAGRIESSVLSIMDIMPTILDLASISHPAELDGSVLAMQGKSFAALLTGSPAFVEAPKREIGWELFAKRGYRYGDWKIVHSPPPYGTGEWQLYNLKTDPGETQDLSDNQPELFLKIIEKWNDYAARNNVILPDWVSGY